MSPKIHKIWTGERILYYINQVTNPLIIKYNFIFIDKGFIMLNITYLKQFCKYKTQFNKYY